MLHLKTCVKEAIELYPAIQLNLSCWSGSAEHMKMLLLEFPQHIWFGMDASVGFAKATHMHECAFDVSLSHLLLETGSPRTIPPIVGQVLGRDAFCHSGMIPLIAEAMAAHKKGSHTAEDIGRAASINTVSLYSRMQGGEKKSSEHGVDADELPPVP
jgi:Tat protein secretion system quality control protein TatD with DNase activity